MYTVVFNMPGYLPEIEPIDVETIEEAREVVIAAAERIIDSLPHEAGHEEVEWDRVIKVAKQLPAEGGVIRLPDGYVADVRVREEDDPNEQSQWAQNLP